MDNKNWEESGKATAIFMTTTIVTCILCTFSDILRVHFSSLHIIIYIIIMVHN